MESFLPVRPSEVAPHVGAWIEIYRAAYHTAYPESHPTWVRGLKCLEVGIELRGERSHPTWVRGLK